MKLLDSNILIYAPQPSYSYLRPFLINPECVVSEISMIEVLGYHQLSDIDKEYYEAFFSNITVIPIDRSIVLKTIELRQMRKMSVGDAIHAATAIVHNLELVTRNDGDFKWIKQIVVVKPTQ